MYRIQYVSTYLALAEEGLVPKMECPMDQGSLLCTLDKNDNIKIYCSSCSFKKELGLEAYTKLVNIVKAFTNVEV